MVSTMAELKKITLNDYKTQCSKCSRIVGTYPSLTAKRLEQYNVKTKAELDEVYLCSDCSEPSSKGKYSELAYAKKQLADFVTSTGDKPMNEEQEKKLDRYVDAVVEASQRSALVPDILRRALL